MIQRLKPKVELGTQTKIIAVIIWSLTNVTGVVSGISLRLNGKHPAKHVASVVELMANKKKRIKVKMMLSSGQPSCEKNRE
jgi:hypothetical protein